MRAPMDDPFIQLDREHATRELKLKERGAEQGALELPSADMQAPDVVEADIAAYIQDHFERAQIDAANQIRTYDSRLASLALLANLSSISAQSQVAVGDFKTEIINRRGALSNSRDAIVDSYKELAEFRRRHGLTRPAHDAPPSIATVGTMMVAWVAETTANSLLLRLNDNMGWLGGIVAAAVVGAINVFVAGFVGRRVWPLVHRRERSHKITGWLLIVAWVFFTVAWNLAAAHYRDAKSLGMPEPETAALGMMGEGLHSLYSYGLLVAGLVFATTAAFAGYRMDDPYPGYGAVSRRHQKRCEDYMADVEDATDELKAIRDDAIGTATDVRMELGRQQAQREQIVASREAFRRRYEQHSEQLETAANALLQVYRSANRKARSSPAPARFDLAWRLPRDPLPTVPGQDVPRSAIDEAEASLVRTVSEVSAAFNEAIASFEPLDDLKKRMADG